MKRLLTISLLLCALGTSAKADDLVKVAIGQRGNWDTAVMHLGDKAGIFKKHGITQELLYTSGGGETQQAVLSGSVDVGWASPPFGFKQLEEGAIRIVAKANDAPLVKGQTIRLLITNTDALAKRKEVLTRFMDAYRETVDYMYSDNPQVIKDYAEFVKVPHAMARRVRDEFFPKSLVDPDAIKGVDTLMKEAVTLKFINERLTQKQLDELIQI